jgi:hypothetical protein
MENIELVNSIGAGQIANMVRKSTNVGISAERYVSVKKLLFWQVVVLYIHTYICICRLPLKRHFLPRHHKKYKRIHLFLLIEEFIY